MTLLRAFCALSLAGLVAALPTPTTTDDVVADFTCLTCQAQPRLVAPSTLAPDTAFLGGPSDDGSLVDVLVVYTPATEASVGTAVLEQQIQTWVDETNGFYLASGAAHRMRLAHSESIAYTTSGNILTDVARLRDKTDGFLDSVHPLRDAVGADLVFLVVASGSAGTGYQMDVLSTSFESSAFSVISFTTESRVFAHEAGHNMGLGHNNTAGTPGVVCDAYGFRNAAPEQFRTIMSSPPGAKINLFSSPDLTAGGFPLGVSGVGCPGTAADAVNAFSQSIPFVANFRVSDDGGSAFEDVGFALPGSAGAPLLVGAGTLVPGFDMSISLSSAAPSSIVALFVALDSNPVAFKGGTLAAFPLALTIPLGTDASGGFTLPFTWPAGVVAATEIVLQAAIADAGATKGVALSNAVIGTAR